MRGVDKIVVTILTNNKWVGKVVPKAANTLCKKIVHKIISSFHFFLEYQIKYIQISAIKNLNLF